MEIVTLLIGTGLLAGGAVLGYFARQTMAKRELSTAEGQAAKMIEEAKKKAGDITLEAKNTAVNILDESKKDMKAKEEEIRDQKRRTEKREEQLEKRLDEIEKDKEKLVRKADDIRAIQTETEKLRDEELEKLEKIAGLSREEAEQEVYRLIENEHGESIAERMTKLEKEGEEMLEGRALELLATVLQKYSRSHVSEFTTTTVEIPSDDIKGKIIGKEGRNIRALEKETGVELIVDDTPESVVISGFDPVRREVARVALEKLISDGRIHPGRIEEAAEEARQAIDQKIKEAGEAAAYEAGVAGLHPKLLYILGRLRYRYSYKQNVLLHSLEVSYISGALASELGANVAVAKKAGLLHDIGKAVDHEIEGTHVNIGIRILEKFNVQKEVIDAMKSHHDDYPHASVEAYIVTAADIISAARPGARKETAEKYIKRLEELEALINTFDAVEKSYAIQAGREVRVFVNPEKVDDMAAMKLAQEIAGRIQDELKYPGEVKVVVMRETRSIAVAR